MMATRDRRGRNSAARALAARRTDTVGLILIDIGNALFVDARG
jgi:hypothetical protein